MKAYVLPSGKRIAPFGDPVSESMIGNERLADIQRRVMGEAGLEVIFVESVAEIMDRRFVLTYDDVFFTKRVFDDLMRQAKAGAGLRCGLPAESLLVKRTRPLQKLDEAEVDGEKLALYRLYVLEGESVLGSEAELKQMMAAARPVRARFKEKVIGVPTPPNIVGYSHYEHPVTSSVVMEIGHWVHLLWANQLSIQIHWVETILGRKFWTAGKLLAAGLGGLLSGARVPGFKWSAAKNFNRIGRNCDIHPTARLEFCQLGDNVRVGAYALVRGSLLGDNVQIEDRANVIFSVIGHDCFISKNSTLVFCAGYPEGDLCINGIQCTLFGRKVAMTSLVRVVDIKAKGEIQVLHEGELQPVGTNFLGACFGHEVFAGLDVTVQSGRAVPNGTVLVKDPDSILRSIPETSPTRTPVMIEGGTTVPVPTRTVPVPTRSTKAGRTRKASRQRENKSSS